MSRTIQTLTFEESEKLIEHFHRELRLNGHYLHPNRDLLMVLLLLDAGLRVGELVQLKVCDVCFDNKPVIGLTVRASTTKTNTTRTVPFTERILKATIDYMQSRWHWVFNTPDGSLFPFGTGGRPITTRQVERIIRTAGQAALGKRVHPHMLRHTFATRLMQKTNIRIVQTLLGHSSLQSTQIYTHPNAQDLKKAIDSME